MSVFPASVVTLTLANGTQVDVNPVIASRVRGIDADGDLLVCDGASQALDGNENLVPLTPCCHATGTGADYSGTEVACRNCHRDVDVKYGGPGRLAVGLAGTVSTMTLLGAAARPITLTATAVDGPSSLSLVSGRGRDERELRERLKAATRNSGLPTVHRCSTVRVDPPEALSAATAAAVAVAVIAASAGISTRRLAGTVVLGDVNLDGTLRPVHDVLLAVRAARAHGVAQVIVPLACMAEAELSDGVHVLGAQSLADIAAWMRGDDAVLIAPSVT